MAAETRKELEIILIEKEKEENLDKSRKEYYQNLKDFLMDASHNFTKNVQKTYENLGQFVNLGAAAYDMHIMKMGYHLGALVAQSYRDNSLAIKYLKNL